MDGCGGRRKRWNLTRLPATIAVVTNIDPEHLEHWGNFDSLRKGFLDFISNIPFYGIAICCSDHPEVQKLIGKISDRRIKTFGLNAQSDVRAINLNYKNGEPILILGSSRRNLQLTTVFFLCLATIMFQMHWEQLRSHTI